jgi:hypothetical protein
MPSKRSRHREYVKRLDLEAFDRLKPKLLPELRGRWALVSWSQLVDTFPTSREAYARGGQDDKSVDGFRFSVFEISESTLTLEDVRKGERDYLRGFMREACEAVLKAAQSDAFRDWMTERKNRRAKVAS